MAKLEINISKERLARLENLFKQRGCTPEEWVEPWIADSETHMGHDPSDSPEDQEAAAKKFGKKAARAETERQEVARKAQEQAEASRLEAEALTKPEVE